MSIIIQTIVTIIFLLVALYGVIKEREELGCYSFKCNDQESVYLINTKKEKNDTCDDLMKKLESITSYHEKGGVWKRCFILATICLLFVYMIHQLSPDKTYYSYVITFILLFTVIYLYHNYINYHHFRKLKLNAIEILDTMKNQCFAK